MMLIFGVGEKAAFTHFCRATRDIRFFRAADIRLIQLLAFVARDIDLRTGPKSIRETGRGSHG